MTRSKIEAELLAWMQGGETGRADADRFERLALALFAFQYSTCEPYALLCRSIDRTPDRVDRAEAIPPVPTGAFKEFDLRCFPAEATIKTFRTSGTSLDRRGALHLDTLSLYEASLIAILRCAFVTDLVGKRPAMHLLVPPPEEAPDSSLSHMFEVLRREEGGQESAYHLRDGRLDVEGLERAVARTRAHDEPLVLAGTSFAFVHLLDTVGSARADDRWRLPEGSRVLETGGFKGRSRSIPRDVLRREIADCFGLDERRVVNQYGMTELGSQFYDSTLVDSRGPRRKLLPPWTRVRFVDPDSGRDVHPGEVGMIVVHDLANTGSVAALQTADLGRAIVDDAGATIGFDVVGREEGAEARGCSIATDVMLGASEGSHG